MSEAIPQYELTEHGEAVEFSFRKMSEIEQRNGGIADTPHRHNYYTIIWVKSGKGKHYIDFEPYEVKSQRVFFVHPDQVHLVLTEPGTDGVVMLFTESFLHLHSIDPAYINGLSLFQPCSSAAIVDLPGDISDELQGVVDLMESVYNRKSNYRNDRLAALLRLFLISCVEVFENVHPKQTAQPNEGAITGAFIRLLEKHFKEHHKVAFYAQKLAISPSYLNTVVRSRTGISAKDHISRRIVVEAKRMARLSDESMKEVSYQLGFSDPSHFGKFFRKLTGYSFLTFREK